jgi:DNA-binding beta-propeller fold protein YncE
VFVPASIAAGDPEGTVLGWLHVTDAGADELVMLELSVAGGPIGAPGTGIAVSSQSTFTYPFMSQPIGIAYSTMTGYLYIGNRGNGTVIAVDESTGAEIATFDTGLGADAINGIDVYAAGAGDVVFFTNTAANTLEKFEAAN